MAANFCNLIPQVNVNNEFVDSKLFTNLLSNTSNREEAKEAYLRTKSSQFNDWFGNSEYIDDLGEPQLYGGNTLINEQDQELKITNVLESPRTFIKVEDVKNDLVRKRIIGSKKYNGEYWVLKDYSQGTNGMSKYVDNMNYIKIEALSKPYLTYKNTSNGMIVYIDQTKLDSYNNQLFSPSNGKVPVITNSVKVDNITLIDIALDNTEDSSLKKVLNVIKDNLHRLEFTSSYIVQGTDLNFKGRYFPKTGRLEIEESADAETIAHEFLHSFLYNILENPKTTEDLRLVSNIKKLMESSRDFTSMPDHNAYKDIHEFVAELMSNKEFYNDLKKNKPWYSKLITTIKAFLGIRDNSVDSIITTVLDKITNSNTTISPNASMNTLNKPAAKLNEVELLKVHQDIVRKISSINTINQKLKKDMNVLIYDQKVSKSDARVTNILNQIVDNKNEITKYTTKLVDIELEEITDFQQNYTELAHYILDDIEARPSYDMNKHSDINQLSTDARILDIYINNPDISVSNRAKKLQNNIISDIENYAKTLTSFTNLDGLDGVDEVTLETLRANINGEEDKDISWVLQAFKGPGDYESLEANLIYSKVLDAKTRANNRSGVKIKELYNELKLLNEWAEKNVKGTNIKYFSKKNRLLNAYKLLMEVDHLNKLSLIKPYTKTYYNTVNSYFKKLNSSTDPTEIANAKLWLRNNYYKKPGIDSPYSNPAYKNIFKQGNEPLARFYNYFKKTVQEGFDLLPDWVSNNNPEKIPNAIKKQTFEFIKLLDNPFTLKYYKYIVKSIFGGIKSLLLGDGIVKMYDKNGNFYDDIKYEELSEDDINLRMIGEVAPEHKSQDLGLILNDFIKSTYDNYEMGKVLPELRLIQNISKNKRYTSGENSVKGENSRIYRSVNKYITYQLGNTERINFGHISFLDQDVLDNNGNVIGKNQINLSDILKYWLSNVRNILLALAPISSAKNVLNGYINNIIYASKERYFNKKDILAASKMYYVDGLSKNSKVNMLLELFDPLSDLAEHGETDDIKSFSKNLSGKIWDNRFILQKKGEEFVQSITGLAYLRATKVDCTDGKSRSLLELFSVENGKLKWNEQLAGYKFDFKKVAETKKIINSINEQIHGNYSRINAAALAGGVEFETLLLFKKWLPAMVEQKFGRKAYNYRTGKYNEGEFISIARLAIKENRLIKYPLYTLGKLMGLANLSSKPRALTDLEVENIKSFLTSTTISLMLLLLAKYISPPPEEDKKKRWKPDFYEDFSYWDDKQDFNENAPAILKSTVSLVGGLIDDISLLANVGNYNKLITSIAISSLADSIIKLTSEIFSNIADGELKTFKTGPRKGEIKIVNQTLDLIPIVRPINKLRVDANKTINDIEKKYK